MASMPVAGYKIQKDNENEREIATGCKEIYKEAEDDYPKAGQG